MYILFFNVYIFKLQPLFTLQTQLSLAKLAALASDDPEDEIKSNVLKMDYELNLIAHQEEVPLNILEIYGYDVEKLRVLSPSELINVILFLLLKDTLFLY